MSKFLVIWLGQLVSALGSGLTSFALGVWVYQQTGDVTRYAMIGVVAVTPALIITPFAGVLVDRVSRKKILLLADFVPAVATVAALVLYQTSTLALWHILIVAAVNSVGGAFTWLAFSASTTLMVPKEQLGRAGGLVQISQALSQIISPVIAGVLVANFGLTPILAADTFTFLFAVLTLALVAIPQPTRSTETEGESPLASILFGLTYIRKRPGLLLLLLYFAAVNFAVAMASVLFTPLILSQGSAAQLGAIISVAGVGMLIGGITMSIWGGPKRKVPFLLASGVITALLICLGGLYSTPFVIGFIAFLVMFMAPMITATNQVLWQTKIPPEFQGRVFSIKTVIALASMPVAFVIAGPLADHVFEPAMLEGGPLAVRLGWLFGTGTGRGLGLMLFLAGIVPLLAAVAAYFHPRLRNVESEIPDALPDNRG